MKYKKIQKLVPWCNKCNTEIEGNGSFVFPYQCKCGEYYWNDNTLDYELVEECDQTTKEVNKIIEKEGNEYYFKELSYPCYLWRHQINKTWCGYVQVPKDSFLFKKDYNNEIFNNVDVHGGLTYSDDLNNDNNWWFGFDTAHFGDWAYFKILIWGSIGKKNGRYMHKGDVYRDKEYCINECKSLVKQLIVLEEKQPKTGIRKVLITKTRISR